MATGATAGVVWVVTVHRVDGGCDLRHYGAQGAAEAAGRELRRDFPGAVVTVHWWPLY